MQQIARDEVVGVLGELALGERCDESVDLVGGDREQQESPDEFGGAVDAFGDDADREDAVEPGVWVEVGSRPSMTHTDAGPGPWYRGRCRVVGSCGVLVLTRPGRSRRRTR